MAIIVLLVSWSASIDWAYLENLWRRFQRQSFLAQLFILFFLCTAVLYGGSKGRGQSSSPSAQPSHDSEAALANETGTRDGGSSGETTNKLNIVGFHIDNDNEEFNFELSWATNLFDDANSMSLYLFMSTNLLEKKWMPLGLYAMSSETNVCALSISANNIEPLMEEKFYDLFNGLGFFRFCVDRDSDNDGLADSIESLWTFTSLSNPDSDGDGLSDGDELMSYNSNPLSYDTDGDCVSDGDEIAFGSNPSNINSDGDEFSDEQEIGLMTLLDGDEFMWFDIANSVDILSGSGAIDYTERKISLPTNATINNIIYTKALINSDGVVHLLCPTNINAVCRSGYGHSGGLSNHQWSAVHTTIALCNANLYARKADWGSAIRYGSAETNGQIYSIIEYRNIGLYKTRNTNELITCQLIIPSVETNTLYVSYLCASNTFREIDLTVGVQCGGISSFKTGEKYYNLSYPLTDDFPSDGMTIKYSIGTATHPAVTDTDGDGLSDSDEWLLYKTDPRVCDSDSDGLSDFAELTIGTDPIVEDTDGDGLPDGWEVQYGRNAFIDDSSEDADNDGLSNLNEYHGGSNPCKVDTDGDGLSDLMELGKWEYVVALPQLTIITMTNFLQTSQSNYNSAKFLSPLPFPLQCAGFTHTNATISIDGVVALMSNRSTANFSISENNNKINSSTLSSYHTVIAPYWDNLYANVNDGAQISMVDATDGTNRYAVIEYSDVRLYSKRSDATVTGTFQVILPYAETNTVYVRYVNMTSDFDGSSASIGAQLPNKGKSFSVSHNQLGAITNGMVIAFRFGSCSNPILVDSDNDGLSDREEFVHGTSSRYADTDNDGLNDKWEIENNLNPLSAYGADGADGDPDEDLLPNIEEYAHGANPREADSDGDGISDYMEVQNGTSPSSADTDKDDLSDFQEAQIGTNPSQPDTDGDGLNDGWEVNSGFNPCVNNTEDDDISNDPNADPDGDGLSNSEECGWGTDPHDTDTDGDGIADKTEISQNSDPMDASDQGVAESRAKVSITFGDPSGSHSEKYRLILTPDCPDGMENPPRECKWINAQYGECDKVVAMLARGVSYNVTMEHAGTNRKDGPDYDYRLKIEPAKGAGVLINDPDELIADLNTASTYFAGAGKMAVIKVIDASLRADYNRDGVINDTDEQMLRQGRTLRHWVNDDNDEGDVADDKSDNLGQLLSPDYRNSTVDGRCDLLDFVPIQLNIHNLLNDLDDYSNLSFKLIQQDGALKVLWTSLSSSQANSFLTQDGTQYGSSFNESAFEASVVEVDSSGADIPETFVSQIAESADKGIFLIEGVSVSASPLKLEIYNNGKCVFTVEMPLSISSVEEMYRWLNIRPVAGGNATRQTNLSTPPNFPDAESNGKMFIFVHGYSVSEEGARGWNAEMFKRLWQSGANSMYTAVTWYGNDSQAWWWLNETPNYYVNVVHAFESAEFFSATFNNLPGTQKIVAAHSLGNMLVSSAITDYGMKGSQYFMFNAAVPIEAYAPSAITSQSSLSMRHPDWQSYSNRLWASRWHELFPTNDLRNKLTWRGRFGSITNAVNFYSSEEDVLANGDGTLHPFLSGNFAWVNQEMRKGLWPFLVPGNNEAGWSFNSDYDIPVTNLLGIVSHERRPPSSANLIAESSLRTNSFFGRFDHDAVYGENGSSEAGQASVRRQILADAIPAESFAAGANPIEKFGAQKNKNVAELYKSSMWIEILAPNARWLHGDIKKKAYTFVRPLFIELLRIGGLK